MEFVCPPYFPTSSAADLLERLTAIVETTTANLNAIRDAGIGGLGEVPGRRPVFFCQENQYQYRRRESRFWVSDPEPGPRAVLPDAGKMATVSGMTPSADDWVERAGNEESDGLTPFCASPCPRWKLVEFVCLHFFQPQVTRLCLSV